MAEKQTSLFKLLLILVIAIHVVQPRQMEFKVNKHGWKSVFMETERKYNWFQAVDECTRRNMSLITVDTPAKNATLHAILDAKAMGFSVWIGGHDLGKEGQFVWSSTGRSFLYTNWRRGMPDDYKHNEDCVHVNPDLEWNDVPCYTTFGYICEGGPGN